MTSCQVAMVTTYRCDQRPLPSWIHTKAEEMSFETDVP
jgi:hypothetical protein